MDLSKYEVHIKHHVFVRAMQRGIHPDRIENTNQKSRRSARTAA